MRRQLAVLLVCIFLFGAVLAIFTWRDRQTEWKRRVDQAEHRLNLAYQIITGDLGRVRSDLLFVANLETVRNLDSNVRATQVAAQNEFVRFLESKKQYQQVRLIDLQGMEVVRVDQTNKGIMVVPQDQLQNKSERYYIRESFDLKAGQIFVSNFDLNEENGIVERPIVPVVRFVTPISDAQMNIHHLLVFNYLGQPLLNDLAHISIPGQTFLCREDGQFLLGPTPDASWGWILGHDINMQSFYPVSWSIRSEIGQTCDLTTEGAFAFRDIGLQHFGDESTFFRNRKHWLSIVSHHPRETVFQSSQDSLFRLLVFATVSLIPLLLITRFWAVASVRRQQNIQRIMESEKQLRDLSERLLRIQEDERKYVSREIHDELGQQVTAINLDLKMAVKEASSEELKSLVKRAISESEQLLESLHHFATRIRPPEIDDLGLVDAIKSLVWEFEQRTRVSTRFESNIENEPIASILSINVFRLIQESLNNILKHSDASEASIKIIKNSSIEIPQLEITVSDDGKGTDYLSNAENTETSSDRSSTSSRRLGILGMKERVQLLNGSIQFSSELGKGTTIFIQLPLDADEGDAHD